VPAKDAVWVADMDDASPMRFAYADPPYPGMARSMYKCAEVDHRKLILCLSTTYDGWALSTSVPALRMLLPLCPPKTRVGAWTKPFAFMRPKVWPCYAWEPVIFMRAARPCRRDQPTPFDWVHCKPHGVTKAEREGGTVKGQKPEAFAEWLFGALDMRPSDEFVDLFPGSGRVGRAWEAWRSRRAEPPVEDALCSGKAATYEEAE